MWKGFIFALSACLLWGLIFVIPPFLEGFTTLEVLLGRYLIYGTLSLAIFFQARKRGLFRFSKEIWIKSFYFSMAGTIGYYALVVLSTRLATPDICALILGICPITIAFYGNWKQKEISYRKLLFPSLCMLVGLGFINIPHILATSSPGTFLLGILCSLVSLASWSWYVVANSRFLKERQDIDPVGWSTLIGVASFIWAVLFGLIFFTCFENQIDFTKYTSWNADLLRFLIGSAILGLFCSWIGSYLWNKASCYLPVSFVGQLMIFETIFGVLFVYLYQGQFPPVSEWLGIGLLLFAIVFALRSFSRQEAPSTLA